MKIKQIFINSVWFGIIPKVSTLINVLILPLITPYLTPFDYGIMGVVTSYSGIIAAICSLGLHIHLTNSYYEYGARFRAVWGRILYLLLLLSSMFSVVLVIILIFVLKDISGWIKVFTISLATFSVLFSSNSLVASHYYPLKYQPKPLVFRNLIASFASVLVVFVSIYYFKLGFLGWLLGSATAAFIAFILFLDSLWKREKIIPISQVKIKKAKEWFSVSLPVVPHALGFMLLSSSDRIIMDIFGIPMSDIGLYSNGFQIGDYITLVTTAMATAIAPRIQELYRSCDYKKLRNLYYLCQAVALCSIMAFAVWLPELYKLLIRNEELQQACSIAIYASFANAVLPLYTFMSTITFIEKRTKLLLWLVFFPGILNVVLNFIFIPIYGYRGAIFTTLVAHWSLLLIPFIVPYYRERARKWFGNLNKLLLLGGIIILVFYVSISLAYINIGTKMIISLLALVLFFYIITKKVKFDF